MGPYETILRNLVTVQHSAADVRRALCEIRLLIITLAGDSASAGERRKIAAEIETLFLDAIGDLSLIDRSILVPTSGDDEASGVDENEGVQ